MDPNFYRFRSVWLLGVRPATVYEALERFEDYPRWWPEVRRLRLVDEECCEVTCRSVLPYDLTFLLRPARRDPDAGVLEASMSGDLNGFSRWRIRDHPEGSRLVFEEEVTVHKRLLCRLAPVARPAFRANHAVMMRHARAGLAAYLAGLRVDAGVG
ncbi:MAG: SRPBCC family protein [Acidimicrobiales bacterium]